MQTYLRYARTGLEFTVAKEIARRGCVVSVIAQKYLYRTGRGKLRTTEITERAAIPNIIFVDMGPEDRDKLSNIYGLSSTFEILPTASRADVLRFRTEIDAANEAVQRAYMRSGALTPEYATGAPVRLIEGPMAEMIGRFRENVRVGDEIACRVEMEVMGRVMNVDVSPDKLKAAG